MAAAWLHRGCWGHCGGVPGLWDAALRAVGTLDGPVDLRAPF